jgi:hypothetical protein
MIDRAKEVIQSLLTSWANSHAQLLNEFRGQALVEPQAAVDNPDDLDGLEQGYKCFADIKLAEGQTFTGLEAAFKVAGFNRHRARTEIDDGFGVMAMGSSYWNNEQAGTATVFIYPHEARSLREQGYQVTIHPARPTLASVSMTISGPQ